MEDNRKFAVIWAFVEFFYGAFCLVMSFYQARFTLCRSAYIMVMAVSAIAFCSAVFWARKKPLAVYPTMFINYVALFGVGLMIARILLQNGITGTIMVFASALIAPILFLSNTLWNILIALLYILTAVLVMNGLPADVFRWCITDVVIFFSIGVTIGHFINKARFERYVFAESAIKLAESNAKVAELQKKYAYFDQMTGLLNRRAYSEKIEPYEAEMPAACCVVMVDINGLKKTNDMRGHAAGDELIIGTADCLRRSFDGIGTIYRLGGDEFCVIADGGEEGIQSGLRRLQTACGEWKGEYIDGISVSYGVATTEEFSDFDELLKAADERMYAFKNEYYKTVKA